MAQHLMRPTLIDPGSRRIVACVLRRKGSIVKGVFQLIEDGRGAIYRKHSSFSFISSTGSCTCTDSMIGREPVLDGCSDGKSGFFDPHRNPKSQTPSTKEIPSTKLQTSGGDNH